jgi:O-antigen/teichoic acid export membrane protein
LTLLVGITSTAAGALVLAVVPSLRLPYVGRWTVLLPVSIVLAMAITTCEYWLNRCGAFGAVSSSRLIAACGMTGTQILLGWRGADGRGLITGLLVGMALALAVALVQAWRHRPVPAEASLARLLAAGSAYSRFPRYLLAAQACNSASNHAPTLVLGTAFGAALTGSYTLASRAMTMVDLVASAVGQAFYPQAARQLAAGEACGPLLRATMGRLLLIAAVVFPIVGLLAPTLFAIAFGERWREAGEILRLLLPVYVTRFVFYPAGLVPLLAGREDWYLLRQVGLCALVAASLAIGGWTGSFRVTLVLYSLAYTLLYLVDGLLAMRLVRARR